MNKVLITGHSSGIGLATTKILLQHNCTITAIARRNIKEHENLTQLKFDLSDSQQYKSLAQQLRNKNFDTIILNAGFNNIKPAEAYSIEEIIQIINTNFTAHAVILKSCINKLIENKGTIIALGSFSGTEAKPWNNYYGASKAALHHLMNNFFEQYRKQGVKVCTIIPDIVHTDFYKKQDFEPGSNPETFLTDKDIAQIITDLILNPKQYVPTQIVLRPQKFELKRKK